MKPNLARKPILLILCIACAHWIPVPVVPGADEPAAKTNLPTAQEIIVKFVKAIGGREAVLKQTSLQSTGKLEMPAQGINGTVEVFAARPNKILVVSTIPGLGDIKQGYNGQVGWSIDPAQGPRLLKGGELEQLLAQADFYSSLHEATNFSKMETLELTSFEGKDCYKVKLISKAKSESEEFFDKTSGLLVGISMKQSTPLGSIPVTSVLSDYKEFGGVKIPTRVNQKLLGIQQVMTINQVEVNKVADSVFELPEQIKALAK